jgi:hypothetical protein
MEQPKINLPEDTTPFSQFQGNAAVEETLVVDPRGTMTPSQFVEHKLVTMLRATPIPVSQVHSDRYTGR